MAFNRNDRSRGKRDFGRKSFGGNRGGGDRQMTKATCSNCGKECMVPFKPTGDKPVYCSDCFEKVSGSRPSRSNSSGLNLDAVNTKLDRILELLEKKV